MTIITGFLGNGNTNLLNRVELSNGCVCCTMQKDVLDTVGQMLRSPAALDHLVFETTGLADPLPLAQSLLRLEVMGLVTLDAILTFVDANRFDENLEQTDAAYRQLAHADVVLLNQVDLVDHKLPERIESGLRTINADAPLVRCVHAGFDLGHVLDLDLGTHSDREEIRLRDHRESPPFSSVGFTEPRALNLDSFREVIDHPPGDIIRAKGVLNVAGSPQRMIFQSVGGRVVIEPGAAWEGDEARRSELDLIGRRIDRVRLAVLYACTAGVADQKGPYTT